MNLLCASVLSHAAHDNQYVINSVAGFMTPRTDDDVELRGLVADARKDTGRARLELIIAMSVLHKRTNEAYGA